MDEISDVYNGFIERYDKYMEMIVRSNELLSDVNQELYKVEMHYLMVEKIYMNIYMLWEKFVEHSFILYLLGKVDLQGDAYNRYAYPKDKEHAYEMLKGTRQYPDWTNMQDVIILSKLYFEDAGPYKLLTNNPIEFIEMKIIRNRISHMSIQAERKFNTLVIQKTSNSAIKKAGEYLNQIKENGVTYFEYYSTFILDYVKAICNTELVE